MTDAIKINKNPYVNKTNSNYFRALAEHLNIQPIDYGSMIKRDSNNNIGNLEKITENENGSDTEYETDSEDDDNIENNTSEVAQEVVQEAASEVVPEATAETVSDDVVQEVVQEAASEV